MSYLLKIGPIKKITQDNYQQVLERIAHLQQKIDSGRHTGAEVQEKDRLSKLLDKHWSQDEEGNCIACTYSGSDEVMYQYYGCPNCYCERDEK